jgi:hypothetical protein
VDLPVDRCKLVVYSYPLKTALRMLSHLLIGIVGYDDAWIPPPRHPEYSGRRARAVSHVWSPPTGIAALACTRGTTPPLLPALRLSEASRLSPTHFSMVQDTKQRTHGRASRTAAAVWPIAAGRYN